MHPWIKALVWAVPHNDRAAAAPLLLAGGLALVALASAYFAPPTRGEIERAFGDQWTKETCAASGTARCRIVARAVRIEDPRLQLPAIMGKAPPIEPESEPVRLALQTNLDAAVLRRAGTEALRWSRMKTVLGEASIDSSLRTDPPPAATRPARRKRP